MASCRDARRPRFAIAPLVALALAAGCSSDATPPEVSAALALAFQDRLQAQAEQPAARDNPAWPLWQAHLFRVGFEGVDDDLALSEPVRGAIEAYWDGDEVLAVPAEASLAEQGALLAAHHRETEERFTAYATALQTLADEDDDETAALSEALAGLRAETQATAVAIALPADPTIRYETLVAAADAARQRGCSEPEGCRELFPGLLLLAAKTAEGGP